MTDARPLSGPRRRRLAVLALLTATLTGATIAALGGSALHVYGASAYIAVAAAALFAAEAIAAQVIGGQLLAASILIAPEPPGLITLAALVAGVIATAELLALAARLDTPDERDVASDLRRSGAAVVAGGTVFGLVLLAARLPGPPDLLGITLAAAACAALAILLTIRTEASS